MKEFWKIDEEIKNHLIEINKNNNIQSLYSKYGPTDRMLGSYLEIGYSKSAEDHLFKSIIPEILFEFNALRGQCIYEFNYPRDNANYNGDRELGFSCTDNSEHFRINTIKISYKSYGQNHLEFWSYLVEKLKSF
ncbi:hypothetical protein [Croceitalea rosinachiae]|uniref:Uncharacterized protein n=1 Tax=Croceitalea rosinachiae TaxID=3075596 RepID=A0ABU3ADN3_9FLAO|nr:hypothetical protein [Croceitalea sp. F388]MDT0608028.1 hypothetical protein [Croceitalea sp. F388]